MSRRSKERPKDNVRVSEGSGSVPAARKGAPSSTAASAKQGPTKAPAPHPNLPASPPPPTVPLWRRVGAAAAICFGLMLLVAVPYAQVGYNDHKFIVCDDNQYIYENPQIIRGLVADGKVRWDAVRWAFQDAHAGNWHPLTWLSHMADCQLFGWDKNHAGNHHLVSVVIHALSASLLFLVLRWMTGALWPSAIVAAFFAIHPLRVESVAWAAERKDVLSGLFFMLTLLAYAWYTAEFRDSSPLKSLLRKVAAYLLVLLAFAMGLMSKSMLVTVPCVLLLLDIWPLGRWLPKRPATPPSAEAPDQASKPSPGSAYWVQVLLRWLLLLVEKIPLFILSAIDCWVTWHGQAKGGALNPLEGLPLSDRVPNAFISYVAYLWQTIWPTNMAIFYAHAGMLPEAYPGQKTWTLYLPGTAAALLLLLVTMLLAAITIWTAWRGRRCGYCVIGWLWYLGMAVPVIGLVQVGTQARADRYTYLPLIGVYLVVVWGVYDLAGRWKHGRRVAAATASVVVLILVIVSFLQVGYWRDSFLLFEHAIAVTPNSYFGHNHLGLAYDKDNKLDEAAKEYQKAIDIKPNHDFAINNLAVYYAKHEQYDKADALFRVAVGVNPNYADACSNLGVVCFRTKRLADAEKFCKRAAEIMPDKASHWANLALAYESQGKLDPAIECYKLALQLDPSIASVHRSLSILLTRQGNYAAAKACLQGALQIDPNDAEAYNTLAVIAENKSRAAEAQGHGDQAKAFLDQSERYLNEAVRLQPNQPLFRGNLERLRVSRPK
jgi:protein O-mannosyl-transferase